MGAHPTLLPKIDEESGSDNDVQPETKRKAKGMSGKLCTDGTTVVNQITLLHMVLYMCSGDPALYDELDSMAFVSQYITVVARE